MKNSESLQALSQIAHLANRLAKQLAGTERALAYRIKADALSALVVSGAASVNGRHPDNTLGLDFFNSRLHCPYLSLTPQARSIVDRRAASIQRKTPLLDLLTTSSVEELTGAVHHRAT